MIHVQDVITQHSKKSPPLAIHQVIGLLTKNLTVLKMVQNIKNVQLVIKFWKQKLLENLDMI